MQWVVGGALALGILWVMNRSKNQHNNADNQGLAPLPAPQVPTVSLCQAAVTVGAGIGGAKYGVPPQVGLSIGAAVSKPACKMGKSVGKAVVKAAKVTGKAIGSTSKGAVKGAVTVAKKTPKFVVKRVTAPARTAKKLVTRPKATVKGAVKTTGKVVSKINPMNW